jgi:acyl carrier protein
MTRDALETRVVEILAAQALLDPESLEPEDDLVALGLDSLGLVEAIFAIEEAFGISVPFNANEPGTSEFDISTVGSVVAGVRRLVAARP